jgi:MFS family permease
VVETDRVTGEAAPSTRRQEWAFQLGSLSSFIGDGIRFAAIPLLAAQWGADPGAVSLLFVAGTLPWLLMSPIVGAIVDRSSRSLILVCSDGARIVGSLVLLGLLAVLGDRTPVVVLALLSFAFGVLETLYDVTGAAVIPSLVADDRLESANSRYAGGQTAGRELGGPVLGAALHATSRFAPYLAGALLYTAATLALLVFHRGRRPAPEPHRSDAPQRWWAQTTEGLRFLRRSPVLATLALVSGIVNLSLLAVQATSVLFVLRTLHGNPLQYSLVLAAPAVGAVGASLFTGRILRRIPGPRALLIAVGGAAVSFGCAALAWTVWWVVGWYLVLGVCFMLWNVVAMSTRQRFVPDELRGRVESAYRCVSWGALSVGAMLGGALAEAFGLRAPLVAAAALSAIAVVVLAARLRPSRMPA